jgi:signal transduction histidine kinase
MSLPNELKGTPSPRSTTIDDVDRLRAENAALKGELKEARKSNQQYLQNVAHQLTAPLGAIKWSIEALKDPEVSLQRKSKLLSSIYSQATILVHLVKNFALMSNLEADLELGQFRERPEPVDILRLCINLANDFQPQAAETAKKIVVDDASFAAALQDKKVQMVKNLIAQALSNLLENAVKYSDSRGQRPLGTPIELQKKVPPEEDFFCKRPEEYRH